MVYTLIILIYVVASYFVFWLFARIVKFVEPFGPNEVFKSIFILSPIIWWFPIIILLIIFIVNIHLIIIAIINSNIFDYYWKLMDYIFGKDK